MAGSAYLVLMVLGEIWVGSSEEAGTRVWSVVGVNSFSRVLDTYDVGA